MDESSQHQLTRAHPCPRARGALSFVATTLSTPTRSYSQPVAHHYPPKEAVQRSKPGWTKYTRFRLKIGACSRSLCTRRACEATDDAACCLCCSRWSVVAGKGCIRAAAAPKNSCDASARCYLLPAVPANQDEVWMRLGAGVAATASAAA
ncbi:hypothetical protein C8R46DRAFT_1107393 [Mycena filopes]|nr:hypothetical protein C8R46DRAFT_1107393 [Mycena filopes]